MNHDYVRDNNLAEQYVTDNLSIEESELFELHFLRCEECVEQVEITKSMRNALRSLSGSEIGKLSHLAPQGIAGFLALFSPQRQLLYAASILFVLLVLPASLFSLKITRLRRELDTARASVTASRSDLPGNQNQDISSMNPRPALVAEQNKKDQITARPPARDSFQRKPRRENVQTREDQAVPQVNTPIFILDSTVDVERDGVKSQNELVLPTNVKLFVISLDVNLASKGNNSFQATLTDAKSHLIWQGSGLRADDHDAVVITFPSSLLASNSYFLSLWQINKEGKRIPAGNYRFHISKVSR